MNISKDAIPRTSPEVRRRRYGDRRFLLRRTEIYAVDEITDAVWLGAAEGLAVEQIALRLADGLPLDEALAATIAAVLTWFESMGFAELT